MSNFKGTKGEVIIKVCYFSKPRIHIQTENREVLAIIPFRDNFVHLHGYEMANSELIYDAFNVRQQINFDLPDLLKQRNDMLEMLQLWCMDMEERGHAYGDCYTMTKELIKKSLQ